MKKLIAIAMAAAVAPSAAIASGPTLYGKIHMGINYLDNDSKSVANGGVGEYKSMSLTSVFSRIGVKGTEDLGSGLKVGFLMEWQVGMDGSRDLSQRNRGINLSGGFGKILFGRWDSPMKKLNLKVEFFSDKLGDLDNVTRGKSYIDGRHNNAIIYYTPKLDGFSASIAYYLDTTNATGDDTDNQNIISGNVIYTNGPLLVGVGYNRVNAADSGTEEDEEDWRLGATYKFGAAKIGGSFTLFNDGLGINKNDFEVYSLSGSYGFGNNSVRAQYVHKTEGLDDDEAATWAIGFDHTMSKRTSAYVAYSQAHNGDQANAVPYAKINNGQNDADADSTPKGITVGLIHKF